MFDYEIQLRFEFPSGCLMFRRLFSSRDEVREGHYLSIPLNKDREEDRLSVIGVCHDGGKTILLLRLRNVHFRDEENDIQLVVEKLSECGWKLISNTTTCTIVLIKEESKENNE